MRGGTYEHIGETSSEYECYLKVKRERMLATGATWNGNWEGCFADFGDIIVPDSSCPDCRACLFSGSQCFTFSSYLVVQLFSKKIYSLIN